MYPQRPALRLLGVEVVLAEVTRLDVVDLLIAVALTVRMDRAKGAVYGTKDVTR